MFRTSDIIMLSVIVASAAFTYKIKHDSEAGLAQIRKLESRIRYEEDTIDVLKADWSMLTQPARLEKLVRAYEADLALKTTEPTQYVRLKDVPKRPLTIEQLTSDPDLLAALGEDPITTGAIGQ